VAPTGPGERAVLLPWFWPDATSVRALIDSPTAVPWSTVRTDPGLLLFLLSRDIPLTVDDVRVGPADLRAAAAMFDEVSVPWLSWGDPTVRPVIRTAAAASRFGGLLAESTGVIAPARASAGGWLAYAGWLAVGIVEPSAIGACLVDPAFADDPFGTQARVWGMSRADIAWRLSTTWPMTRWARAILGRLDASPDVAHHLGGDRRLQAVVQIAVVLAEQGQARLFVADEFDLSRALAELKVTSGDLDRIRERFAADDPSDDWIDRPRNDPRAVDDLAEGLLAAADELDGRGDVEPTLSFDSPADQVQTAKLTAVAEFAAGASHEINNPLAVISGQSEYLLRHESDDNRRQALESIVRQTRRIHAILTELMYFARPPAPQPEPIELGRLVRDAVAAVAPLAVDRGVEIQIGNRGGPLWVDVDLRQLTIALSALIRNGVEAAPAGGWVRVTSTFRPDRLDVVVDDSGPGPDERSVPHLFDPFYSGRAAGRGRGLGLPAAWRLARAHGGDVRYVPVPGGPTRFVLTLPSGVAAAAAQRKTA
jgi:signal transduction histidine kinase